MTIRIFGLFICLVGIFFVANTLLVGAVSAGVFFSSMAGLMMAVGGTVLTSDFFHQESESSKVNINVKEPQRIIVEAPTPDEQQAAKKLLDATQHSMESIHQLKKLD